MEMRYPTFQLPEESFREFRSHLESLGFVFEDRPHQIFLARKKGVVVNLYTNGKIVFGGSDVSGIEELIEYVVSLGGAEVEKESKEYPPISIAGTRIGTDEVGKGDYFGPLVVAGVLVTQDTEKKLKGLGVRDSKRLSETTIRNLAYDVRRTLGKERCEVVWVSPLKYNILYRRLKNVNRILGWAHARVIENLLGSGFECHQAIADQFGDPGFIRNALMEKGKRIELIQVPKAERDIAVAAASILAREKFLWKMEDMSQNYGMEFPRGAYNVEEFGKKFVDLYGLGALQNVAKIDFSTTRKIAGEIQPELVEDIGKRVDLHSVPREDREKIREDLLLECFNLISSFEIELRGFIKEKLLSHYGDGWWSKGVKNEDIRRKAERIARSESKRGRKVDLIDCLDFSHYEYILFDRENWEKIFSKVLKDKVQVSARLRILKNVRDPTAHSRGSFGHRERMDVISAISYLRNLMKGQRTLDTFGSEISSDK